MGKSCSGKSCMVLARLARIKNASRGKSKEAILRAHIRLEISAPINPMRPHNIFAEAAASGPLGRRRQPGKGQRPRRHHEERRSINGKRNEILSSRSRGRLTDFEVKSTKNICSPS